jgi:hypothetical protein
LMTILSAKLLIPLISNFDNCMRSVVDLCSFDVYTPICKIKSAKIEVGSTFRKATVLIP